MTHAINYENIRYAGFVVGYRAYACKTMVTNPHMPGTLSFEHWRDGYDAGVLEAKYDEAGAANDNWQRDIMEAN